MKQYYPQFDEEQGYTHLATYCMIAPDGDALLDPSNAIAGSGS